jgi:hypothetical protein
MPTSRTFQTNPFPNPTPTLALTLHVGLPWPEEFPDWKGIGLVMCDSAASGHGWDYRTQEYTGFEAHPDPDTFPNLYRTSLPPSPHTLINMTPLPYVSPSLTHPHQHDTSAVRLSLPHTPSST